MTWPLFVHAAEQITLKAEACPKCGTPQHGMLPPDLVSTLEADTWRPERLPAPEPYERNAKGASTASDNN